MYICEYEFNDPDPHDPRYSLKEIDWYDLIPQDMRTAIIPNHRLSLRKNMETGEFEVCRHYHDYIKDEVAFSGTLQEAIQFADREWNRYHSRYWESKEPDQVCTHKYPHRSPFCRYPALREEEKDSEEPDDAMQMRRLIATLRRLRLGHRRVIKSLRSNL